MKNLLAILLLFLLVNTASHAQTFTIKGIITDAKDKSPLPFVTIVVERDSLGTVSDFDGNYQLSNLPSKGYLVKFKTVGYEPQQRLLFLKADTILNVQMQPSVQELNTIMVSGSKYDRRLAYEVVSKNIVNVRQGNDMSKSVEKVPGVTIVDGKHKRHYGSKVEVVDYKVPVVAHDQFNTEEYSSLVENEFKSAKENPLSTFSSDVDKASYSNIRRFIMQGTVPPQDAVRVEEMVNYFKYDYPEPTDKHPFSITTEVSDCPWNKTNRLVHIGLKGKEVEVANKPKSNLVFLIDVSGSMNEQAKLPLVKSSMRLLVGTLTADDKVSIVVYAGNAGLVLPPTAGDKKDKIMDAIEQLEAGGSTAGGQGIQLAYNTAREHFVKDGNNRVILATDGDFNVGISSESELTALIEKERESGVFLTVLGFGTGNYKDSKMKQLADKGNGNYAYIDNLMEAQKVMVKEVGGTLFTIAKDVKIQVEFNPLLVQSYRLVGYESRLLQNEDFNDDKKDAGEIGAGHTVTALYEIVLTGSGENENNKVDPLKYQETKVSEQAQTSGELLTVKFRYKLPTGSKSTLITQPLKNTFTALENASDNFRFSAAVAQFGLLLKDSKFKGNSNYASVISLASNAKGKDESGYRSEFVKLAQLAQNIEPYKASK